MNPQPRTPPPKPSPPQPVVILGVRHQPIFGDLYFWFLRARWRVALGGCIAVFLGANALFAVLYTVIGGISGARPGSFADAFYFSVHTMGTIGYGAMYPATTAANLLVILEAVVGLMFMAIITGLVFSKFSRFTGRVVFTSYATVADFNGVPTLSFRIGNDRDNQIVEVTVRVSLTRTEKTAEGVTFYRMIDLPLVRERGPVLSRSWSAMHPITESSPLFGLDADGLAKVEGEILVSVTGTDDTSLQLVHARHTYGHEQILWGHRHADVLSERPDGALVLDVSKFHDVVEAPLTKTASQSR